MAKLLLIDPPLYKDPFWDPVRYAQPLGLWSIASHLQSLGHEAQILSVPGEGWNRQLIVTSPTDKGIDFEPYLRGKSLQLQQNDGAKLLSQRHTSPERFLYVGLSHRDIIQRVQTLQPDIIGLSLIASCHHQSVIDLARSIRQAGFDRTILVGGQHATAMPERVLRDGIGLIDFVVRGEGEQITAAIADVKGDANLVRILPSVCYLDDEGQFVKNKRAGFFELNSITLPSARILADIPMPSTPAHTLDAEGRKYADVMFSVGCHNNCAYCYSPQMRGGLRRLAPENVERLLQDLWDHGFRELVLQDDDLLHDREAFLWLIGRIRSQGFSWQDNGGVELELLDEELVDAIAASNCHGMYVPVNPRKIADRFPQPEALMKVHLLHRIRDHGIYTVTSGIYGVPNLTSPDTVISDIQAMRDFHIDLVNKGYVDASLVFPLSALPGTKWYHEMKRHPEFVVDENWLSYSIFVPQMWPRSITKDRFEDELVEVHRQLNLHQVSYPWFSPLPNHLLKTPQQGVPPT